MIVGGIGVGVEEGEEGSLRMQYIKPFTRRISADRQYCTVTTDIVFLLSVGVTRFLNIQYKVNCYRRE